jgi:hypothetical protein
MDIVNTSSSSFAQCAIKLSKATQLKGDCSGIQLSTNSAANIFTKCHSLYNTSNSGNCYGFNILTGCAQNTFNLCFALNNICLSGNNLTVAGFNILGSCQDDDSNGEDEINPVQMNRFFKCIANYNVSLGPSNNCNGLLANISSNNYWNDCITSYNVSQNQATGIRFTSNASTNNNWLINNFLAVNNRSTNVGNENNFSRGTWIQVGSNNLFTKGIAFNNGGSAPLPANQCAGIETNSVTTPAAPATSNLNGITAPWANLAIAS